MKNTRNLLNVLGGVLAAACCSGCGSGLEMIDEGSGIGLRNPTADAGQTQVLSDMDGDGSEPVVVDGTRSYDSDGQIVAFTWSVNGVPLGEGGVLTSEMPVGVHEVLLTVRDDHGLQASDDVTIVVLAPGTAVLNDNARVMDPAREELMALDDHSLTLAMGAESERINPGDVLIGMDQDGNPFLRGVTEVAVDESGVATLQTEPAELPVTVADFSGAFSTPVELSVQPAASGGDPSLTVAEASVSLIDDADVRVSVDFEGDLQTDLSFELPGGYLKECFIDGIFGDADCDGARARLQGLLETAVRFEVRAKRPFLGKTFEAPVTKKMNLDPIEWGPFDIGAYVQFFAGIEARASESGIITFSDELTVDAFVEAEVRDGRLAIDHGAEPHNIAQIEYRLPGVTGITAYIRAELGFFLGANIDIGKLGSAEAGLRGALNLRPHLDLSARMQSGKLKTGGPPPVIYVPTVDPAVCYELDMGMNAFAQFKISANARILFKNLKKTYVDERSDTLFDLSVPLAEGCRELESPISDPGKLGGPLAKILDAVLGKTLAAGGLASASPLVGNVLDAIQKYHDGDHAGTAQMLGSVQNQLGQQITVDPETAALMDDIDALILALEGDDGTG